MISEDREIQDTTLSFFEPIQLTAKKIIENLWLFCNLNRERFSNRVGKNRERFSNRVGEKKMFLEEYLLFNIYYFLEK